MGAHCQVIEPDGSLAAEPLRPADHPHAAVPQGADRSRSRTGTPIGMRGTASEGYRVTDLFVPEAYSGTREDPSLRRDRGPLYAFTMQGLYAVGVAGRRVWASPAPCSMRSSPWRGENAARPAAAGRQSRGAGGCGSAGGAAWVRRAPGWSRSSKDVWDSADDIAPIDLTARVRVRLGCAHAIDVGGRGCRLRL